MVKKYLKSIIKNRSRPKYNVLVTGAGSGGAENLIEDLRASEYVGTIVGTNCNKLLLNDSQADYCHVVPHSINLDSYRIKLTKLINTYNIDLLIPNNDTEVNAVAFIRSVFPCNVFLPSHQVIDLAQDKHTLYTTLEKRGVPVPKHKLWMDCQHFKKDVWVRKRKGSGSAGSLPVKNYDEAKSWINWWHRHRNALYYDFIVCEYLPGDDYAVQVLVVNGGIKIVRVAERLEYIFAKNMPQGSSSSPSHAKLVSHLPVAKICYRAIKAIQKELIVPDNGIDGIWSFDLKGDVNGVPTITEINIGRFCMICPIFNRLTDYNMADLYVRFAMGDLGEFEDRATFACSDEEAKNHLIRELDRKPLVIKM